MNSSIPQRDVSKRLKKYVGSIFANKYTYMLIFPALVFYAIFSYYPMYGIVMAFKDFKVNLGILRSPWIGFENFEWLIKDKFFWEAFRNTVIISISRIIIQFPGPIILALMLNEMFLKKTKKIYQTIYTFPNFLSWVIVAGIVKNFLAIGGPLNGLLAMVGVEEPINFLIIPEIFRPILYATDIWKGVGWGSIIYLAAMSSINPELYEAAIIDGANRFRRIYHITLPGIREVAVLLLLFAVAGVMNAGFDQIFNLYNPVVRPVSEIIDTYIYEITFRSKPDFGFSTAVGLFKSVINLVLLVSADRTAKLMGARGIF